MLNRLVAGALIAGSFALAGAASAQTSMYRNSDTGLYLEGGYSYLKLKPEGADDSVDSNAITARLGFKFTPMLAAEVELSSGVDDGEFDYNVDEDDFNTDDNSDGDFADTIIGSGDFQVNYLVGAYGKASIPLGNVFDVHARLGYAFIDIDSVVDTPGGGTLEIGDDADGPSGGVGATWRFADRWALRGDYTYFDFDDAETHVGSITVGYKF